MLSFCRANKNIMPWRLIFTTQWWYYPANQSRQSNPWKTHSNQIATKKWVIALSWNLESCSSYTMPHPIRNGIDSLKDLTVARTKDDLLQVGRRRIGGGEFDCLWRKKRNGRNHNISVLSQEWMGKTRWEESVHIAHYWDFQIYE